MIPSRSGNPFLPRRAPANSGRLFWPALALVALCGAGTVAFALRREAPRLDPPGTPFPIQPNSTGVVPLEPFAAAVVASLPALPVPLSEPVEPSGTEPPSIAPPPKPRAAPPATPVARPPPPMPSSDPGAIARRVFRRPDPDATAARERCRVLTAQAAVGEGVDDEGMARMREACGAAAR